MPIGVHTLHMIFNAIFGRHLNMTFIPVLKLYMMWRPCVYYQQLWLNHFSSILCCCSLTLMLCSPHFFSCPFSSALPRGIKKRRTWVLRGLCILYNLYFGCVCRRKVTWLSCFSSCKLQHKKTRLFFLFSSSFIVSFSMFPNHSTDDQSKREADLNTFNNNILQGSLGSLFKHFVSSDEASSNVSLANAPGDDYKRLVEKSRVKRQMTKSTSGYSIASLSSNNSSSSDEEDDLNDYHDKAPVPMQLPPSSSPMNKQPSSSPTRQNTYGFAVGHPIILPIPPQHESRNRRVTMVDKMYDWLFAREDRYFNADRRELSKDIFPAGAEQQQQHQVLWVMTFISHFPSTFHSCFLDLLSTMYTFSLS